MYYIFPLPVLPFLVLFTSPAFGWTALKYQNFFPHHIHVPQNISRINCSATLQDYVQSAALNGLRNKWTINACYNHESCIFDHADEAQKNNWASAQVLLGLVPTLLANLGPKPAEIALLSFRRPILSFLLCMGTGTIYPVRVSQYDDPNLLLLGEDLKFSHIGLQPPIRALAISAGQYLFALGAVVNTLTLLVEIGTNAVVSFDCTSYFFPLIWWLIAVLIHIMAAVPFNMVQRGWLENKDVSGANTVGSMRASERALSDQKGKTTWTKQSVAWVRQLVRVWGRGVQYIIHATRSEITICANQLPPGKLSPPVSVVFLNYCCGALGYFHIIFGTMIFSSLLFIMHIDAILSISRLVVSAALCRLILVMEFGGMKSSQERRSSDQLFTQEPASK
ncbi:hypothetical protein N7G274_002925 [Stereocaulon virgatum]|uniref:Uncharacterized protein n=1 Tax=Stereocaulon virgatum TaxID=373712 RepID=A0ABR4AGE1_9LECA